MLLRIIGSFLVLISFMFFYSCANDSSKTEQFSPNQESHVENSHDGHNHDGHDHSGSNQNSADLETNKTNSDTNNASKSQATNKVQPGLSQNKSTNQISSSNQLDLNKNAKNSTGTVPSSEWANKKDALSREDAEPDPNLIGRKQVATNLPSACSLIDPNKLAQILKVNADAITLKDGSGPRSPHAQSCFFRWTHKGLPNSGVLIQVQDNPLPDEFPEWAAYYVAAKINQGEQMPDGSGSYKYTKQDGLGKAAAFSNELSRYIWRTEKDYVYLVAFNLPGSPEKKIKWAEEIGAEVMKNFN